MIAYRLRQRMGDEPVQVMFSPLGRPSVWLPRRAPRT